MSEDKPKQQTSTNVSAPWAPSQPLLKETIGDATDLYKSGGLNYSYFPGQTVAPKTQETVDSWNMTADRARSGSPLTGQAKDYFSSVARGDYVNAEAPGFQSILDRTRNEVNANKAMSGRYGSEVHDQAVTEALSPILYQNYVNERGAQERAAGLLPGLAQGDYFDLQQLGGVGAQREAFGQDLINEAINRFNFTQNSPANAIALAQQLAGGTMGGTTQATAPVQSSGYNPFMQFAGTALQTAPYLFGA